MQGVLPSKRAQPTHLLKFRNRAYGFDTPGPPKTEPAAVERIEVDLPVKEKKRKSEGKRELTPRRKKMKA